MKSDGDGKARLIRLLAANYSADIDEDTTMLWLMLLAPYSVEQCRRAVLALVKGYGYEAVSFGSMPPFALMQRELDAQTGEVRGEQNAALRAEAEWGRLLEQIRLAGSWREPDLHPTTAFVVRQLGGWNRVCRWKEEELGWKRREFCAAWRECCGREEVLALGAEAVSRLEEGPVRLDASLLTRALGGVMRRGRAELPAGSRAAPPDGEGTACGEGDGNTLSKSGAPFRKAGDGGNGDRRPGCPAGRSA